MRNLRNWRVGIGRGAHRWFGNRGKFRRIQSNEFPLRAMTRAIRTKRGIVRAAGIARIVALLARCIEHVAMFVEPRRRFVRRRLVRSRERNDWRGTACGGHFGNCVAEVAL